MGLETGDVIEDLNKDWPLGTDPKSEGDDHLRLIKSVIVNDVISKVAGGTVEEELAAVRFAVTTSGNATSPAYRMTAQPTTGMMFQNDGSSVNFSVLGAQAATIEANDGQLLFGTSVVTRAKGDGRYARLEEANTWTDEQTFESRIHTPGGGSAATPQIAVGVDRHGIYNNATQMLFAVQLVEAAIIDPVGVNAPGARTIMTREKGDGRYAIVDANGQILAADGSSTFPPFAFASDPTTGMYLQSETTIAYTIQNVVAARVDPVGTDIPHQNTMITRQKGDDRYVQTLAFEVIVADFEARLAALEGP